MTLQWDNFWPDVYIADEREIFCGNVFKPNTIGTHIFCMCINLYSAKDIGALTTNTI
jgi:hypothetical protein